MHENDAIVTPGTMLTYEQELSSPEGLTGSRGIVGYRRCPHAVQSILLAR